MTSIDNDIHAKLSAYYKEMASIQDDSGPTTLAECLDDDGMVQEKKFLELLKMEDKLEAAQEAWFEALNKP